MTTNLRTLPGQDDESMLILLQFIRPNRDMFDAEESDFSDWEEFDVPWEVS